MQSNTPTHSPQANFSTLQTTESPSLSPYKDVSILECGLLKTHTGECDALVLPFLIQCQQCESLEESFSGSINDIPLPWLATPQGVYFASCMFSECVDDPRLAGNVSYNHTRPISQSIISFSPSMPEKTQLNLAMHTAIDEWGTHLMPLPLITVSGSLCGLIEVDSMEIQGIFIYVMESSGPLRAGPCLRDTMGRTRVGVISLNASSIPSAYLSGTSISFS